MTAHLKATLEHVFGKSGLGRGDRVEVDVDAESGSPRRFARVGGAQHVVTAVHGRWREWSIAGVDAECWRVESDTGLVAVLARDLDREDTQVGVWVVTAVWD